MDRLSTPACRFGDMVRVIGASNDTTACPAGMPPMPRWWSARSGFDGRHWLHRLVLYAALVGWSRIAAGMHFPADVLAGWVLGLSWRSPVADAAGRPCGNRLAAHRLGSGSRAASAVMTDQLAKFAITRTFATVNRSKSPLLQLRPCPESRRHSAFWRTLAAGNVTFHHAGPGHCLLGWDACCQQLPRLEAMGWPDPRRCAGQCRGSCAAWTGC